MSSESPEAKKLLEAAANLRTGDKPLATTRQQVQVAAEAYAASLHPKRTWSKPHNASWGRYTSTSEVPIIARIPDPFECRIDRYKQTRTETQTWFACPSCRKIFGEPQAHWCDGGH